MSADIVLNFIIFTTSNTMTIFINLTLITSITYNMMLMYGLPE